MSEVRTTWRDIAAHLRAAIADRTYEPGARLPSRSQLMREFGVAPQTVVNAINALRAEGLIVGLTGSGWYVRERPATIRAARTRLSRSERAVGRGAFTSDAHAGGWVARVTVEIRTEPAADDIAEALHLEPGTELLVRDRVMFADDRPVQLAASYLPRDITVGTVVEQENSGPGGVYARLEENGHTLSRFQEAVRIGQATAAESDRLDVVGGTPVFRIRRTAYTAVRPVELAVIVAVGERFELLYEFDAR